MQDGQPFYRKIPLIRVRSQAGYFRTWQNGTELSKHTNRTLLWVKSRFRQTTTANQNLNTCKTNQKDKTQLGMEGKTQQHQVNRIRSANRRETGS